MHPALFTEGELNAELHRFARTLQAPEEYRQFGYKLCRKVINRLSVELTDVGDAIGFEIHASHIGGTLVRESDVMVPEFDLVIHVEEPTGPVFHMTYFLDLAMKILKKNQRDLKIIHGSVDRCQFGIKFMFEKGMVCYIWPLTYEEQSMYDDNLAEHIKRILTIEAREAFMREQSPFAHDLTRLAKFWFQSKGPSFLGIEECTRSTTIHLVEMISVAAALDTEARCRGIVSKEAAAFQNGSIPQKEEPKILQAIEKFFKMLKNLDCLKLMFEHVQNEIWASRPGRWQRIVLKRVSKGKWRLYPLKQLNMMPSFSLSKCFIQDPTSDNSNLLQYFNPTVTIRLGNFAARSLQSLTKFQNNSFTIKYGRRPVIEFAELFEPAPPNKKFLHFPKDYSVIFDDKYPFDFVYVEVENADAFAASAEIRLFTYIMKTNLHLVVKSVMGQGLTWRELGLSIERAIRNFGKRHIPSEVNLLQNVDSYDHPSDVIIYIPYGRDTEVAASSQTLSNRVLRFGMSW